MRHVSPTVPLQVIYGAGLDTGILGSGFPLDPSHPDDAISFYAKHAWNINNFPQLKGKIPSLLRHIEDKITGVMGPWMYVGMMYSAFCWHLEDHMFYRQAFCWIPAAFIPPLPRYAPDSPSAGPQRELHALGGGKAVVRRAGLRH